MLLNLLFFFVVSVVVAQNNCSNNEKMYDSEGNAYEMVRIGSQCWMKENMRTLHTADGQPIALQNRDSLNFEVPFAYYPGNDENHVPHYGLLYNWAAASRICPSGWRLPTSSDFFKLTSYLKDELHLIDEVYLYLDRLEQFQGYENFTMGKALADTAGWQLSSHAEEGTVFYNQQANNKTDFSARPAGCSSWNEIGSGAYFWLADHYLTAQHPRYMQIQAGRIGVYTDDFLSAKVGMSVRCIREKM